MAKYDYIMIMTYVKTTQFKARLNHYLNLIRNGEQLIVTDRKIPVARVVPFNCPPVEKLTILSAKETIGKLKKIKIPLPLSCQHKSN